jgi:hypothetical protein
MMQLVEALVSWSIVLLMTAGCGRIGVIWCSGGPVAHNRQHENRTTQKKNQGENLNLFLAVFFQRSQFLRH